MSYKLYDAEIEYLESSGTQYIEIPPIMHPTDMESKAAPIQLGQTNAYIIGQAGTNGRFQISISRPSNNAIFYGYGGNKSYGDIANVASVDFQVYKIIDGQLFVNDVAYSKYGWISDSSVLKCIIFGVYQGWNGTITPYPVKISYLKMSRNGAFIYDLIPVRVGNIGYMYDKVSGKLFGNAGTGSFVLGPDVAPGRYANEIAFLESTGSQYIDTGVNADSNLGFDITYAFTDFSEPNYVRFGAIKQTGTSTCARHHTSVQTGGLGNGYMFGDYIMAIHPNTDKHNLILDSTNQKFVYDGTETSFTSTDFDCNLNYYLFARNEYLNDAASITYAKIKINQAKIYSNGVLVRDFIPVEYNNIGYMYDKVSGKFFANQGTGKFVLGHRAPRFDGKACARSYTRRQLLAKAPEEDWSKHYLTFKVLSAGTITFTANNSTAAGKTIQYSTNNGETWSSFTSTTEIQSLGNFIAGTKVLVKGNNSAYGSGNGANYNYFGGTAKIALYGNIMSMINGDAYIGKTSLSQNAALSSMFINNANLIDAKHLVLPATSITASYMYASMFRSCTALKRAPKELPARAAQHNMYNSMFRYCSSLVEAPVIQLRNLGDYTVWFMFQNCSKLNYIKAMFTTTPNITRCNSWVVGVASSGTFVKNSAATWNVRGANGIPNNWTVETASE